MRSIVSFFDQRLNLTYTVCPLPNSFGGALHLQPFPIIYSNAHIKSQFEIVVFGVILALNALSSQIVFYLSSYLCYIVFLFICQEFYMNRLWIHMQLAKINRKIGKNEVRNAIKKVGLNPDDKKHVGKFSLGMRQRLGLAQAIMEDPALLILDEPMNGLDKEGVAEIREYLLELKNSGKTILLTSHSAKDIGVLCDLVFEMNKGNISEIR